MQPAEDPVPPPDTGPRERILAAAFATFMEHGYAGASTLEIARRARVSKRDLYAAFRSKQEMLAACVQSRVERMRPPSALPAPADRTSLAAILAGFGARFLHEFARPEVMAVYRLAITEAERAPEVARDLDALGRVSVQTVLADWLAAAQKAGLLRRSPPVEMAETFLALLAAGGLLPRLLLRVIAPPQDADIEHRARMTTVKFLHLYESCDGADANLDR